MTLRARTSLVILAIILGLLFAWGIVGASPAAQASVVHAALPVTPTPLPIRLAVESPDISFIDSPAASCVLVDEVKGTCMLNWYYLYAYADPNYIISMTVEIDGQKRASYHGFFQTYMVVPSEMLVFEVACGLPGSGGELSYGMNHSYVLRARDSNGLGAANYGQVACPTGQPKRTFFPISGR